jgi:hypothetical protein
MKETKLMIARTPRLLLVLSAVLLVAGAVSHAAAFSKVLTVIGAAGLPRFYSGSFKALWLGDSATLFLLAAVFCLIAARPTSASRSVMVLVALIPAAMSALLYAFLGNFFAGHLLLAVAVFALVAGMRLPGAKMQG